MNTLGWNKTVEAFLLDRNALASRSLINCHALGLDSILFDNTPEKRVRLFITRPEHNLWTNATFGSDMSVALHPHHCAVRLIPVLGKISNILARESGSGSVLNEWRYESPITKGVGQFVATGKTRIFRSTWTALQPGNTYSLAPKQIHTVYVGRAQVAAWLVIEGYEDEFYEPLCYSNAPLDRFDFSGMYQAMDRTTLDRHLKTLGLD